MIAYAVADPSSLAMGRAVCHSTRGGRVSGSLHGGLAYALHRRDGLVCLIALFAGPHAAAGRGVVTCHSGIEASLAHVRARGEAASIDGESHAPVGGGGGAWEARPRQVHGLQRGKARRVAQEVQGDLSDGGVVGEDHLCQAREIVKGSCHHARKATIGAVDLLQCGEGEEGARRDPRDLVVVDLDVGESWEVVKGTCLDRVDRVPIQYDLLEAGKRHERTCRQVGDQVALKHQLDQGRKRGRIDGGAEVRDAQ
mmetsp:Transcript_35103/g.89709  ORF Transcript_35103/g.89709 Transcript_35103/m.89709 type:complete len:254 (-) Transcript_35103:285-1046(-)